MADWRERIRTALPADEARDEDVIEELAQHVHQVVEGAVREGLSTAEADGRAEALIAEWRQHAATLRRARRRPVPVEPPAAAASLSGVTLDLRYAARLLRRQPRYALVATATLALGIGVTAALFGIAYAVLLKPLPWPEPDRLMVASETRGGRPPRFGAFSNAAYLAWRETPPTTIAEAGAWSRSTITLTDGGDPERMQVARASATLFHVLAIRAMAGRLFDADDERADDVMLLAESVWRERYGRSPSALGRVVRVDGRPRRVVGIVGDAVAFPDRQVRGWLPLLVSPPAGDSLSMFNVVARLRPAATPAQAAAEATARGRFAAKTEMTALAIFGGAGAIDVAARPLAEAVTANVRPPLIVLLVAAGFLLLAATANLAGLQLARATTRRRELAIRAAVGAGLARVVRQLAIESLLLGIAGGVLGFAVAFALQRLAPAVLPAGFPRVDDIGPGLASALCATVLGVAASLAFGIVPAWGLRRLNLTESLADGLAAGAGAPRSSAVRVRTLIMAGQVAIACVLLVGAVLLARTFVALLTADRGYEPAGVLTARLSFPDPLYAPARRYHIVDAILRRLQALPTVTEAAFTSELPLTPGGSTSSFTFRSGGDGETISGNASPRIVSPAYFRTLQLRLVSGRGFEGSPSGGGEPVAIVNRSFATRYLRGSPLDARLPILAYHGAASGEAAVIGVVDDVRYPMAADSGQPEIYYPYGQFRGTLAVPVVTLLIRTGENPDALVGALRSIVRDADPGLAPEGIATMQDRMLGALAQPRLYAVVLGGFAAAAVVVAAVGVFGLLSYLVAQRSREVAVRLALGATRATVAGMVFRQGFSVAAAGVASGLAAALVLTRSMAALLYGIDAHDAFTLVVVPAALLLVAAAACAEPALRASRVDSLRAMRE